MLVVLIVFILTPAGATIGEVKIDNISAEYCSNLRTMILLEHPDWRAECVEFPASEARK